RMHMSTVSIVSKAVGWRPCDLLLLSSHVRVVALLICAGCMIAAAQAQTPYEPIPGDSPYVVEGVSDTIVYSIGQSLRVNGTAKNGAFALGGDVIVQGTVDGDVAAVGGSVIQLEGARINGDVMVIGGSYRAMDKLSLHWSARSIGFRILAILFWFIVSLALTAAMPGTISRGITRLQLTSLRVALIGFLGAVAIGPAAILSLRYLPTPISAVVGLMALLLILIAGLFGRVMIYAATGRWIQQMLWKRNRNSEAVALLLGTTFWIILSSLPYVWPFVVAVIW